MDDSPHATERRLAHSLAIAPGASLPSALPNTGRLIGLATGLREKAEEADWRALHALSVELFSEQVGHLASIQRRSAEIQAARDIYAERLSRAQIQLARTTEFFESRLSELFDETPMRVATLVDALRGLAISSFELITGEPDIHLEIEEAPAAEQVARLATAREMVWTSLHAAAMGALAPTAILDLLSNIPTSVQSTAALAALALRDSRHPFSSEPEGKPRQWAARVSLAASAAVGEAISQAVVAGLLVKKGALAEEAHVSSLRKNRKNPKDVTLSKLLDDPEAFKGTLVEFEGFVTSIRIVKGTGDKTETRIELAPLVRGELLEQTLALRVHRNLMSRGLGEGAYVRAGGIFLPLAPWAQGSPGVDVLRHQRAESSWWPDRAAHAIRELYDPTGGYHFDATMLPSTGERGAAADLIAAPMLRGI